MRRPGGFDGSTPATPATRQSAEFEPPSKPDAASKRTPKWKLKLKPEPDSKPEQPVAVSAGEQAAGPAGGSVSEPAAGPAADREAEAAVIPIFETYSHQVVAFDPEVDGVRRARVRLKDAGRERRKRERREQRRFTEHLRVRRRRWFIAGCVVLGLALFVVVGVFTPIMAVKEIQLQGVQSVNTDELQTALSRFEGVPLALVSDQDVHRAIEPFPLVQRYSIERIPPHTLVVRIEERAAVIALEREGGFDLLDPAGVLLGRVAERPVGVPLGSPELTDTASPAFLAASNIVRDMPEDLRQQLVTVQASNAQDVSFELTNGTQVFWGESKDTQRKSVVLRSMLASIGAPGLIDVSAPEAPVFK